MALILYNKTGEIIFEASPSDNSTLKHDLMSESVLNLTFSHPDYHELQVGDYAIFDSDKYLIAENYQPVQKSTLMYEYSPKLYGFEGYLKRVLMVNLTDGAFESNFTLDGSALDHVTKLVDNLNRLGLSIKIGNVIDTGQYKSIDYKGLMCSEAAKLIAEAFETEWWFDGDYFNLTKCERDDRVELGYLSGLTSLTPSSNDNVRFFTRLIPLGSTRNIDKTKYGYSRLQLPDKSKYVEKNMHYGLYEAYEENAFSHIYPRRTGTVSEVRVEDRKIEGIARKVYYFKDASLNFDPNKYELPGLVKNIVFQSGTLNGRDFECNYNSTTKEFEIINVYPTEESQLPGSSMIPRVGDQYILYNITMPDEYYTLAETEYKTAVDAFIAKYSEDMSVYKASSDYIHFMENNIRLKVGSRIRLRSDQYFSGYRDTRVVSITRNINNPYKVNIDCSAVVGQSKMENITGSIEELKRVVSDYMNPKYLEVIKTWDETDPSNYNVFSALRSLQQFINKKGDAATGLIKFLKGAHFGEYVNSMASGKGAGIDSAGNAQFESIEVRGYMKVMELIINRLSAQESDYVFTDSGNCTAVEDLGQSTYRLTMRKSYDFDFTSLKEDDIIYSIVNNLLTSGEYYTVWMRVLNVNINANTLTVVLFPPEECPTGRNFPPIENINVARRGNVTDKTRQSCFYLSSSEGAIVFLDGVTKPILEDYNYQMILGKPKHLQIFDNLPINFDHTYLYVRGLIFQDSFHVRHTGVPVRTEANRGEWSAQVAASEDPYRYTSTEVHLCWHHGCKWSCYTDKTLEEPKWNATSWVMVEGNSNLSLNFVSSDGYAFVQGRVDTNVAPVCWLGHIDISDDIFTADWEWTRDSGLPVEDANWNAMHAKNGRILHLTNDDMPSNWSTRNKVKFTCSAYVRDGNDVYKVTNTIIA